MSALETAPPRTAADALEAHGFSGERLLKLARRIAYDELRRRGAYLDESRLEDLVGFLVVQACHAARRYDDSHEHRTVRP